MKDFPDEHTDKRLLAWLRALAANNMVPIAVVAVRVMPEEETKGKPYEIQIPRVVNRVEIAEVLEQAACQLRR